jgi:pyridoxal phosphate enzyme (YggS family)
MGASPIDLRLSEVRRRIRAAESAAGRPAGSVGLVAVSKRQPAALIRAAFAAGQSVFGESYLQEALDKGEALADLAIEWHFIGRLQANKTRAIAQRFDWVHGLADADHARRLSAQRPPGRAPLNCCIQVNLSGESSKGGVAPEAVADLLGACAGLPGIAVVGLMTLPAPTEDPQAQRAPFAVLRRLRERLATPERALPTLSMGMSDDLESAIWEGATLVRIGTALFGPRP